MKTFLMYKGRDFDPKRLLCRRDKYRNQSYVRLEELLPWNERSLAQDLGLEVIWNAMAAEDPFLSDVAMVAMLASIEDPAAITYRHHVFADCLKNAQIVKDMYQVALEAIEAEKKNFLFFRYPTGILSRSVDVLQTFLDSLKKLRAIADQSADQFTSEGFSHLFVMLKRELSDEYFLIIEEHLKTLKFRDGVMISAQLDRGGTGKNYVLRKPPANKKGLISRMFAEKSGAYSFQLNPRDDDGHKTLSDLNDTGVNLVANATAQSMDHILSFFQMMRTELAFYIGCLNLHGELMQIGEPVCAPISKPSGQRNLSYTGLYDLSLALHTKQKVVGNDLQADGKNLFIITGANTGGKSTFLRSIGIAQLMMQAGMFVAAESFSSETCASVITHYKREEDSRMESGKWDEELGRMSEIVDHIKPDSIMLFNESFASTNEREGSEIAGYIVHALLEKGVKVFFVTHLYSLARNLLDQGSPDYIFLRAERRTDGTRPFKLIEGRPLETSYGEDLYKTIFSSSKEKESTE